MGRVHQQGGVREGENTLLGLFLLPLGSILGAIFFPEVGRQKSGRDS